MKGGFSIKESTSIFLFVTLAVVAVIYLESKGKSMFCDSNMEFPTVWCWDGGEENRVVDISKSDKVKFEGDQSLKVNFGKSEDQFGQLLDLDPQKTYYLKMRYKFESLKHFAVFTQGEGSKNSKQIILDDIYSNSTDWETYRKIFHPLSPDTYIGIKAFNSGIMYVDNISIKEASGQDKLMVRELERELFSTHVLFGEQIDTLNVFDWMQVEPSLTKPVA